MKILEDVARLYSQENRNRAKSKEVVAQLLSELEEGNVRAAVQTDEGWDVQPRVKKGILLGFDVGEGTEFRTTKPFQFRDKDTFPTQKLPIRDKNIRVVPGGTTVRRGAYVGDNVTIMPPAYINVGAFVDENTMVDSHALVGSCAQIGKNVHLSAGAQIGGVLEPIGQAPVIVEDEAFIGGNTGIFEGVQIGSGAVVAAGCNITSSVPVYDLVEETVHRGHEDSPLRIPPDAVVVSGGRPVDSEFAEEHSLQINTPVIIKYRDEQTEASAELEELLR